MNDLIVVEKIAGWEKLKALVLDSVSSPITKRVYNMALDEFLVWFQQAPRPGFTKATVSAWRVSLEARGLGSSSIIIRMSATRKLAAEAADNGLLAPELAAGIARVRSAKSVGIRVGNWLSVRQAQSLLNAPDVSTVRGMPQRNLGVELLRKLLQGEIRNRRSKNVVQARSFTEMLEQTIRRYQNRTVEAAQVIEELIALAKDMRNADRRGMSLGLSEDELAFYDALETNDSAVKVLGEPTLRAIVRELVETVRKNVTIDWTLRENIRAHLRVLVKRILRKHGYPPDKQEKATQTVLEQAEVLSEEWITA